MLKPIVISTFLEEEMELGSQTTNYDDFKFLTTEKFECLKLTNLIGTNLLRAYMHGFFIDHRPYKKVMMHLTFSVKRIKKNMSTSWTFSFRKIL